MSYIYEDMNQPIIILGGGLAGLTAAIHLSLLGHSIIVIEKNKYPKHKVCGEYISNEVVAYFRWLGLQTILEKSHPITNFRLAFDLNNAAQVELPLGGFGISRYKLDYLLYEKAKSQQVQFIQERATEIHFIADIFKITLSSGLVIESRMVIGSFGKRSTIDIQLKRNFIQQKSHWMAVKSHYQGIYPDHLVGLYPFEGGYCGVSKVENDILNICYIVRTKVFKKFKKITDFEHHILSKNKSLSKILKTASQVFENPLTISQISFEDKKAVEEHVIMIGDAAGLIHPLCGNGMAMAIHSAKIASELINKSLKQSTFCRELFENEYEIQWNKIFKKRLYMGKILSVLLLNQWLTKFSLKTVAAFPILFKVIIQKTHGSLISVPNDEY